MTHYLQPACRACGEVGLAAILASAAKPAADRLLGAERPYQRRFKHTVGLALCSSCSLVQLVDPGASFQRASAYAPENDRAWQGDDDLAARVIRSQNLTRRNLVTGIGQAVESVLACYRRADIPVLAISLAAAGSAPPVGARGIPVLRSAFGRQCAQRLMDCGQPADVIHVRGELAAVADLADFVAGLKILLNPAGLLSVEVPYVRAALERADATGTCLGHLSHFSLTALERLLRGHGFHVTAAQRVDTAGALRVLANRSRGAAVAVADMLAEERGWGVDRVATYQSWAERMEASRTAAPIFAPTSAKLPTGINLPSAV